MRYIADYSGKYPIASSLNCFKICKIFAKKDRLYDQTDHSHRRPLGGNQCDR